MIYYGLTDYANPAMIALILSPSPQPLLNLVPLQSLVKMPQKRGRKFTWRAILWSEFPQYSERAFRLQHPAFLPMVASAQQIFPTGFIKGIGGVRLQNIGECLYECHG